MLRKLLPFVLFLLPSVAFSQTATVTGHALFPSGGAPTNAKLCFSLQNFKPNLPRIAGTGVLVQQQNWCIAVSSVDGSFSVPIARNDFITPAGTYWRVDYSWNGQQQSSATFNVNATPFNLDTQIPLSTVPMASATTLVTGAFTCANASSTTWTCTHNLNDLFPIVEVYSGASVLLDPTAAANPYTVTATSANVLTIVFTNPQAGTARIVSTAAINIATNQPNAALLNPSAAQTIVGQGLTLAASVPFAVQGPLALTGTDSGNQTVSGNKTYTGTINCTIVNIVRCISPSNPQGWAGSDPGAWINSAAANCAGAPCKIQISAGTFLASTAIVLPHGVWLDGAGYGNVPGDTPGTLLQEANAANLAVFISVTGTGAAISNMMIDGNLTNNPTAQDGVVVSAVKFSMPYVAIGDFKRDNLVLAGATQDTRIVHHRIFAAGRNGIEIRSGATDFFAVSGESVNSGTNNVHASGTVGGIHLLGGDYSGTTGGGDCIFFDGTGGSVSVSEIVGVDINPCPQNGIRIINGNSMVISANHINNVGTTGPVNTYDAIQFNNFGSSIISGNGMIDGGTACAGGPCMRYGVNVIAQTQKNEIGPNIIIGAQTAAYSNPNTFDDILGGPAGTLNVINNTLRIGHAGASNIALLDLTGKAASTTTVESTSVNGDSNARFNQNASGQMFWGPGNAPSDVNLSRSAVGVLADSGGMSFGGGTTLSKYSRFSVSLSPALVGANTCASQSFTVTGIAAADILIAASKPTEQAGLSVGLGHVTGANTATINFCNNTGVGITPTAAETYQFVAVQ